MKVTQVSVTVHEKRNHPYEFGHFDCGVTLTAEIEPGDDPYAVASDLRRYARGQVEDECCLWIGHIEQLRDTETAQRDDDAVPF